MNLNVLTLIGILELTGSIANKKSFRMGKKNAVGIPFD